MNKDKSVAVVAQSLYLANLLLMPGLSFLVLLIYFHRKKAASRLSRLHLYRSVQLSLVAGLFLAFIPLLYLWFSDSQSRAMMLIVFYFVCFHAGFVMLGIVNLARAMSAKCPLF